MPLEGKQIGRYHILRILGSGGMGEVYLAEDARIGQQVAIKIMRAETGFFDERGRDSLFLREVKTIALLDHPRILPLFDYGDARVDDMLLAYLVMPYRQDGSLADWLRRKGIARLSPQQGMHILGQAADALQHAHDHNIVHQDVKPSNFLVRADRELDIFLTDFGISRLATATSNSSQAIRGTPTYMAPEQWEGQPVFATDQYALAVTMYELLTGRPPFQGNPGRVMYQHINTLPQPASTLNPAIPGSADAVLLRALAKRPEERFDTISAFANAFQQALSGGTATFLRPTGISGSMTLNSRTSASEDNLATYIKPSPTPAGLGTPPFGHPPLTPEQAFARSATPGDISATLAISREEASTGTTRVITLPGGKQAIVAVPAHVPNGHIIRIENTDAGFNRGVYLTIAIQDATPPLTIQQTAETMLETATMESAMPPQTPPALSEPSFAALESRTLRSTTSPARLASSATPIAARAAVNPSSGVAGYSALPPARPRKRSGRLGFVIVLLVLILSMGAVAYAVPSVAHAIFGGFAPGGPQATPTTALPASAATVTITPNKQTLQNTFNLTAVPGTPDAGQRQIAARYTNGIKSDAKTVPATGSGSTQTTAAQGTLTFYNYSTAATLNVPSGTSWTGSDGIVAVNDQTVSLPPATVAGTPTLENSSAHTTTAGANTNIAAQDINDDASAYQTPVTTAPTPTPAVTPTPAATATSTATGQTATMPDTTTGQTTQLTSTLPQSGGGATVVNGAAFTGGKDAQKYTIVSQNDINGAENQLVNALTPPAQQDAKNDVHPHDSIIRDVFCKHDTTANHQAGDTAATVTVTTKVTCSYEVYSRDDATAFAQSLLKAQASKNPGSHYALSSAIAAKITQEQPNASNDTMAITVAASGSWAYQFSAAQKQAMAQLVTGKSLDAANKALASYTGVAQEQIQLSEQNRTLLPTDTGKVTIVVQP
ncbi:MAG: protein kinase [Chloroflexota bacterium]|nr:protein kinase [Chloroflexota bacterium]